MNGPGEPGLRDIDLRRLRMFVVVMEAPSLRVAADDLFISQQALSSAIRELEHLSPDELKQQVQENFRSLATAR